MKRRDALQTMAGGCTTLLPGLAATAAETHRNRLGIVIYALGIHQRANWCGRHQRLAPALAFLEECHRFGAGGVQCPFGAEDAASAAELRQRAERYGMHVEAILNPPANQADVERFENAVRVAKEAGATLARTVVIPGRRYERFKTLAEFREFEERGLKSLQLAAPVLARQRFRLAVENHKDQLIAEKLETLQRLGSEWTGLCVDVANNFALMEDPLETVRAFAPFALTVHLKDHALEEYPDGWLLADVALGDGFLDLKAIVEVLRRANPGVKFNLETITRDPIPVPVRTENYWATFPGRSRSVMEPMLKLAKEKGVAKLIQVSQMPRDQQLEWERHNIEQSMKCAGEKLGL